MVTLGRLKQAKILLKRYIDEFPIITENGCEKFAVHERFNNYYYYSYIYTNSHEKREEKSNEKSEKQISENEA